MTDIQGEVPLVRFLDGAPDTVIPVAYIAEFARGTDGQCAYCGGDPLAERSPDGSRISQYFARNNWASTCPCCEGKPS